MVQRKVVSSNDFTDLTEAGQRLAELEKRYNATATPFQWKFTRHDRVIDNSVTYPSLYA